MELSVNLADNFVGVELLQLVCHVLHNTAPELAVSLQVPINQIRDVPLNLVAVKPLTHERL